MNLNSICCIAVDGRLGETNKVDFLIKVASRMRDVMGLGDAVVLSAVQPKERIDGVRVIPINPLDYNQYSMVAFNQLHRFTDKDHLLVFQDDGFISNPNLWNNEFLAYDYIGAPWSHSYSWSGPGRDVGNGGFSLRSRKLYDFCSTLPFINGWHEDGLICTYYRDHLKRNGMIFAPLEIAYRFSVENEFDDKHSIENTFGFHGKQHVNRGFELLFGKEL
jgi:hypothetical protein